MNIQEIIQQVPAWQKAERLHYEPLNGGYTNSIYKVVVNEKTYVVRINGIQNVYLGLDYEDELDFMSQAAPCQIAPKVLLCENKRDFLISEFIEGSTLTDQQMSEPSILTKVVDLLKKTHSVPYTGKRLSTPFSLTRGYLQGAEKLGIPCPEDLKGFLAEMDLIEKERQKDPAFLKHYCHNDAFSHNIMVSPDGTFTLLDWELSGQGDLWFDLATMSFSGGFDKATDDLLLHSYFGGSDAAKHKTLHDIKFVCMIREISWALLTTAINRNKSESGKEFLDFADTVLNRLKQGIVTLI